MMDIHTIRQLMIGCAAAIGLCVLTGSCGERTVAYAAESSQVFTQIAASLGNAVVSISTDRSARARQMVRQHGDASFDQYLRDVLFDEVSLQGLSQMGLGSGVIVDPDGYILTNQHIVTGAQKITITLTDGRSFPGKILGADSRLNLAVLKISGSDLPVAVFADSDMVQPGQWAIAMGNPLGFMVANPRPTVAVGVVSALHRGLPRILSGERVFVDLIQTDAVVNPGNSGGPLVNTRGEIIGINMFLPHKDKTVSGLNFAVPANDASALMTHIRHGGQVLSGWLGIKVQDLNVALADYFGLSRAQGILVTEVLPESPAYRAGLKEKDIITRFNNERIVNASEFYRFLSRTKVGETVSIRVFRNAIFSTYNVRVEQQPSEISSQVSKLAEARTEGAHARVSWRGMELGMDGMRVHVIEVRQDSPAHHAGIMAGDVISQVNARPINALIDVQQAIADAQDNVLLKTDRGYVIVGQ